MNSCVNLYFFENDIVLAGVQDTEAGELVLLVITYLVFQVLCHGSSFFCILTTFMTFNILHIGLLYTKREMYVCVCVCV